MKKLIQLAVLLALTVVAVACGKDPAEEARNHFARGNEYFDKKAYKEAIIEYRNVLQLDAQHGTARVKLAESYTEMGDAPNAFREYVRAADVLPTDEAVQIKATQMLMLAGRYEDAKSRAQKILAINPKNADAQILLGNATAGLKDLDGALKELEEAVRMDPTKGAGYADMGAIHMAAGRKEEAEAAFLKALELDPKSVPAHLAAANYYWGVENRDAAERELRTALTLEPTNILANRALAILLMATGKTAEAEPFVKAVADASKASRGRMILADYYRALNRTADAVRVLRELSADETLRGEALLRIAVMELGDNKPNDAMTTLDQVLAKQPKDGAALALKSTIQLMQGKRDDALTTAKSAVDANPKFAPAHYALGEALYARQDLAEALRAYEEAVRLNPRAQNAKLRLAQLHLARGAASEAATQSRDVLAASANDPNARLMLARADIAQGKLADADKSVAALVKEFPSAPAVHTTNAALQVAKGNLAGAREAFAKASALAPKDLAATQGLVLLDLQAKKTAEARSRADAYLASNPNDARALLLAGRTYAATGDAAGAEAVLRKAIAADPSFLDVYASLTQLYVSQRKLDKARAEFSEIVTRQPKSVGARTMLAMLFEMDGKMTDAEREYESTLALDGQAAVAANNLAWILAESGRDLNRALSLAQTAHSRLPDNAQVKDTLGWIYYKKELFTQAVDMLQEAVKIDKANPLTHFHLGAAAMRTGDMGRASVALREALRLNPKFDKAADAQKMLAALPTS